MLPLILVSVATSLLQDSQSYCTPDGKRHTLAYTASMGGAALVDLDGDLGSKLSGVTCDVDHTELTLSFKHTTDAVYWLAKFHDFTDHFIVGGKNWNCTSKPTKLHPMYILRRVVSSSESAHLGKDIIVRTAMARYDEVFESADISYGATADRGCLGQTVDKPICLGANTACDGRAKKPLPLYTSKSGLLTATCSSCFASLKSDVFLTVKIDGFKLSSLRFGFRNTTLDAHLSVDAHAANATTLAIDKELELVPTTYLLDFKVGAVPFMLFFDVPLHVNAELDLTANAALTFGVDASMALGEVAVTWDPTNHWQHTAPTMTHALTPSLDTSASLEVDGHVALTPSFKLKFDRMFNYDLVASPTLDAEISGSEAAKKVCLDSTYAMDLVASAELDINIPVVDFHKDWAYGPKTVGSWSGVPIKETCVNF